MAQGTNRSEQQQKAAAERRKNSGKETWLKEGEKMTGRFLEQAQDIFEFAVHEYTVQTNKGPQRREFTCLNDAEDGTPCPGCKAGLKRKFRGVFNLIQRDRPIVRKGSDGFAMRDSAGNLIFDGQEDAVVVWKCPSTTLDLIKGKDKHYKGLMSRDFIVARSGTTFSPYVIEAADPDAGAVPMTPQDEEMATKKHDLNEFMKAPSFSEAAQIVASQSGSQTQPQSQGNSQGDQAPPVDPGNPFLATSDAE